MNPSLQIDGLNKRYGKVNALTEVSLELAAGSTLALLGPNGAGKSTLFGCLLGFTHSTSGSIHWHGQSVGHAVRSRFGYTPERIALYSQQTVWENALFFAQLRGHTAVEIEKQLARVDLLPLRTRKAHQLSKGLLQRLALAIALCGEPELLVLDEPFNGLDPALLDDLCEILIEEQCRGATLLISTHTISAVDALATHAAILLQGKLAAFDSLDQLRDEFGEAATLEDIYRAVACRRRSSTKEEMLV